ncbi:MAG: DHA2 family efflux MFS transporter permease subunit [Hyphomicrobiaceae bacterium]|nr:DHA2 family efflux MFS transporter permease subunit [Hyphomicrobiaceae bacterium]MCC0024744.1 DHA2 family efflux MFS transporter permease subunit [Hyphomicrobiaceae bacterium]
MSDSEARSEEAEAADDPSKPAMVVQHRGLLTAGLMLATVMQVLDTTIANVALPHMAASLNAAQSEITWVLTSYIVAAAIATPLTGWFADQLGQKRLFLISIAGFTLVSMLCGLATGLTEMVAFRILQGLFGAMIVPLAQTVLLEINPREKIGQAMAIYGAGIMIGPIIGPTLGGYLTETFNWRYVFFVNLPVGGLAFGMVFVFMHNTELRRRAFDFFGFGMLALSIGALQLLLDRGQSIGWFSSSEAWLELGLTVSGFWIFVVHSLTAKQPFVDLRMFKDRNLTMGLLFIFIIGLTLFSGLALLPPLLQNLMGYPVIETGLVMAPRGVGTLLSMIVVGRLVGRFDARLLVLVGIGLTAYSLYLMTGFSLQMGAMPVIVSGVIQGFGLGFVFVPLSTLTFATIEGRYRTDATSFFSLVRNIGSGVGISLVSLVLSNMIQVNHSELGAHLTATSPMVQAQAPQLLSGNPTILAVIDGLVSQQSAMIAYLDDFKLMMFVSLMATPIVLLLRGGKSKKGGGMAAMGE